MVVSLNCCCFSFLLSSNYVLFLSYKSTFSFDSFEQGMPNDGTVDCMDSNKHMSVIKRLL